MWLTSTPGIKRFATSLPLILVVALGMRLAFAWDYQAHLPHRALGAIPFLFESGNIAYSLAQGHGFGSPFRVDTGPTAWMTPLYPVLLGGIMRAFGIYTYQSWVAAVLMNIFFSTLACIPVFYTGKRIGGIGLAAGAGWIWAIFPNAILLSFQSLWDQSLSALLGATIIWATLKLAGTAKARDWIAYGLLWGVMLMTNASLLSLLPLLLGWAAYRNRAAALPSLRKTLRNTALAFGMVVLCCIPWTIRNYVVMHSLVPLRSILGLQLWVGNNPDANVVWLGDHHPIHDSAERERYIRMGEIAYMSEKGRNAVRYILTHPRHEAELIAGRSVRFWAGGSTNPVGDFIRNRSAWFRYVLVFNLCAAFGALFAIVILFRRHSIYAFPLAAGPVVYPFAYYLTLSEPRYRHPIDPTLMLLTAIALAESARRIRGLR
jgi:hypothetical protein